MTGQRAWIVLGLGLCAACTPAPAPPPATLATPNAAAGLEVKREGQRLHLAAKGDTSYLVVVTGADPSPILSPGAAPVVASPRPPTQVGQAGQMVLAAGAGRVMVYALTPVLTCSEPLECDECLPRDCSVPPLPPVPGPHFARSLTVLTRSPIPSDPPR